MTKAQSSFSCFHHSSSLCSYSQSSQNYPSEHKPAIILCLRALNGLLLYTGNRKFYSRQRAGFDKMLPMAYSAASFPGTCPLHPPSALAAVASWPVLVHFCLLFACILSARNIPQPVSVSQLHYGLCSNSPTS